MIKKQDKVCFVTGDKENLISFVLSPDKALVFDVLENLPCEKRIWLKCDKGVLKKAIEENVFFNYFDKNIYIKENFLENIFVNMQKMSFNTLGLAKKSNQLVLGYDKVKEALKLKEIGLIVIAKDCSSRSYEDIRLKSGTIPIFSLFYQDYMAKNLGVANATYIGIKKGNFLNKLLGLFTKIKLLG